MPFYYRIDGSDTPPDTWATFEQMQLVDLFDPGTLFDLAFYYSELEGISQKYIRYVTFVEDRVLPGVIRGADVFYDGEGQLLPEYRANMDRLRDYRMETEMTIKWNDCLIFRLRAERTFDQSCRRTGFLLPGMDDHTRQSSEKPDP